VRKRPVLVGQVTSRPALDLSLERPDFEHLAAQIQQLLHAAARRGGGGGAGYPTGGKEISSGVVCFVNGESRIRFIYIYFKYRGGGMKMTAFNHSL
jgi:hypothetical protein